MFAFILGLRFLALRNAKGRERPEPGFCLGVRESGWRPVRVPSTSLHNLIAAVGLANLTVFLIRGVLGKREAILQSLACGGTSVLERGCSGFRGPEVVDCRAGSTRSALRWLWPASAPILLIRGVSGLRKGTSQQYFVRNWNECALERVLTAFDGPKLICNRAGFTDRSACGCRDWQTSGSHDSRHFGGLCGPQMTSLMRKDGV